MILDRLRAVTCDQRPAMLLPPREKSTAYPARRMWPREKTGSLSLVAVTVILSVTVLIPRIGSSFAARGLLSLSQSVYQSVEKFESSNGNESESLKSVVMRDRLNVRSDMSETSIAAMTLNVILVPSTTTPALSHLLPSSSVKSLNRSSSKKHLERRL